MTTITKQAVSFMERLNEGFASGTFQDYQSMERLLNGEIPGAEEPDPWRGLRHRPITSWPTMLLFLSGERKEYSLRDVAEELGVKGGHLALIDILKWMAGIGLIETRLYGGQHPFEPTHVKVDFRPAFWNWKFSENGLLRGLYQAFRGASPEEIVALENLRRKTESRNRAGDSMRDGLADRPFWYLRLLAYFRARGGGRFTLAEVEQHVMVKGPGNKAVMHHGNIRSFLHWTNRKEVLGVSFERPEPGAEDRQVGFTVNTDPLVEKWNL